jgi:hypothetical protein
VIRSVSDVKLVNKPIDIVSSETEKILIEQLKKLTEKNKEDNIDQMMRILIDGANEQFKYMNDIRGEENLDSDNFDFYDI